MDYTLEPYIVYVQKNKQKHKTPPHTNKEDSASKIIEPYEGESEDEK